MQPGFKEQVRKQMVDTDLRRSSTVDVVEGRHLMEQLRGDEDNKCASKRYVSPHSRLRQDGEQGRRVSVANPSCAASACISQPILRGTADEGQHHYD